MIFEAVSTVFMLDPKDIRGQAPPYRNNLERGSQVWYGALLPPSQTIKNLAIIDYDSNGLRDIAITTSAGDILHVDFKGYTIAVESRNHPPAHLQLIDPR